ncbi:MAG: hypothetical protein OEZ09_15575 [Betaproteobacteria bacterium]|nr:hypothetical protein [Betaproteobacteria bacterium]
MSAGARRPRGRPLSGRARREKRSLTLPPELWLAIARRRPGVSRSRAVELLLLDLGEIARAVVVIELERAVERDESERSARRRRLAR